MDPNAVQGLRALLNLLNQPNVSREVDRLFRASTPSTASGNPSTPSVTTTAATGSTLQTPPLIRNIGRSLVQEEGRHEEEAETDRVLTQA